jgi:2'-5' RNA ligase
MYWAIELSEEISNKIQNLIALVVRIPKDWTICCDHITVAHPKQLTALKWEEIDNILSNFEGHSVCFKITSLAQNEGVIAVGVSVKTLNKHSHITIAHAQGYKPVESNNLTEWIPVICFEDFSGRLVKKK